MALVAIVDDHLLLAETVQAALRATGHDTLVVLPHTADQVEQEVVAARPDLVLLDLDLGPGGDSTPLVGRLTAAGLTVLLMTGTQDRRQLVTAVEAGAIGYHLKADGFAALADRAARALGSDTAPDAAQRAALRAEVAAEEARRRIALAAFLRLSGRERLTLRELAQGRSVHDIARTWVVSEATVRTHVRGVLTKLDAPSQLAAVAAALRLRWFDYEDVGGLSRLR